MEKEKDSSEEEIEAPREPQVYTLTPEERAKVSQRLTETIVSIVDAVQLPLEIRTKLIADLSKKFIEVENPVQFILDPDQIQALKFMISSYMSTRFAIMLPADTGWGKSRVSMWMAVYLNMIMGMKVAIVSPKNLVGMWSRLMSSVSLEPVFIMTYDKVAGKAKTGCKHPYLTRDNGKTGPYYATDEWKNLVQDGVFLICDEFQALKNKTSARHFALFEMIVTGCTMPNAAMRVLHLSASPIDKKENWQCLYRSLGLILGREMWQTNPHTQKLEWHPTAKHPEGFAFGWLLEDSAKINPAAVREAKIRFNIQAIKAKQLDDVLIFLWHSIWQDRVVVPVIDPVYHNPLTGKPFKRIRANYFITLDEESLELANEAIEDLRTARIVKRDGAVDLDAARNNMGAITKALVKLCYAKVNDTVRHAKEKLRQGKKVIIFCPYLDAQEVIMKKLELYNPLRLYGGNSDSVLSIEAAFNEDSDRHMVLVATTGVGGQGVSFDDKSKGGKWPRCTFMIPTFIFLEVFQGAGRTYRRGMTSDSEVYIVYANETPVESVLINGLMKTETAMAVLKKGSGRVFPGAYDILIEDDGPDKLALRERLEQEKARVKAMMEELQ